MSLHWAMPCRIEDLCAFATLHFPCSVATTPRLCPPLPLCALSDPPGAHESPPADSRVGLVQRHGIHRVTLPVVLP
ncbi:hypothetical protein GCM10010236_79340 [Streptomyces eurythermus]|nr:hypothetical protein GCM10010236_79340 [Streptomyces eurythermus]